MNKKILIITSEFPPGPGGIGKHAFHLAMHLQEVGYTIEILTQERKEYASDLANNLKVNYISRTRFIPSVYFFIRSVIWLLRAPTVVVASGRKSLYLAAFGMLLGHRIIGVLHGHELLMGSILSKRILAFILNRYTHLVAVSEFSSSVSLPLLKKKSIKVIPNGIIIETKDNESGSRSMVEGNIRLLTVGTVSKRKGQHNVLKQMPEVIQEFPHLRYAIVGIIREPETILPPIQALNLSSHVEVRGAVTNEELQVEYKRADIFIMLSENQPNGDVEGFGIAILEANYYGVPAIGAKGCGIEQAILQNKSGILIDPHDPAELINAIHQIVTHYSVFSENARKWAAQHNWKNLVKEYVALIN